jgi:hypothetical protein
MKLKKTIPIILVWLLLFHFSPVYSQFEFSLKSVAPPNGTEKEIWFGQTTNVKVFFKVDSPYTVNQALDNLKNYYLIIDGIPYKTIKVQDMALVSLEKNTSQKNTFIVTYQTKMPAASENEKDKIVLSKAWSQHYRPLHNFFPVNVSIASDQPPYQAVPARTIGLYFYSAWRPLVFALIFFGLLFWVLLAAGMNRFTLLRDDDRVCPIPEKAPFSLSRVQVLLWTFIIFGAFAYIWSVSDFLPEITAAHLVLLGIAAGQRLLAQAIDANKPPEKNSIGMNSGNSGCSVGFFTDLISDRSGLSITRLQYLITTGIFLVVFVTNAIEKLQMVNFSVEQLALMGTSAGLYLWNKKLDQQAAARTGGGGAAVPPAPPPLPPPAPPPAPPVPPPPPPPANP